MSRFYLPSGLKTNQTIALSEEESHHARNVLRLSVGDEVCVFDGAGREWAAVITTVEKKQVTVRLGEERPARRESPLEITLAAALIKGERFEWVIQKAVELGVRTLAPLITEFTEKGVVRQDSANRRTRWSRIALEATKQCERAVLMRISEPVEFGSLLPLEPDRLGLMLVERATEDWKTAVGQLPAPPKITILIGPEGGWSQNELTLAQHHALVHTTLGPRILRAETASIVAVGLVQAAWGDF